jgi:flagellar biosynthesis/type III secretory pathway protein FliH
MITEAEKKAMRRESIRLAELDRISELEVAERKGRNKGIEEGKGIGIELGKEFGIEEGKVLGKELGKEESIKVMHSNGFDADFISKALSVDLEYVKHVLENN